MKAGSIFCSTDKKNHYLITSGKGIFIPERYYYVPHQTAILHDEITYFVTFCFGSFVSDGSEDFAGITLGTMSSNGFHKTWCSVYGRKLCNRIRSHNQTKTLHKDKLVPQLKVSWEVDPGAYRFYQSLLHLNATDYILNLQLPVKSNHVYSQYKMVSNSFN